MASGRKGFGEELRIKERYAALSEPFFKVLNEFLTSDDKNDKKWACEQLTKAFTRMIPQTIEGGDPDKPIPILYVSKNQGNPKDNGDEKEDSGSPGGDVGIENGKHSPILDSSGTVGC